MPRLLRPQASKVLLLMASGWCAMVGITWYSITARSKAGLDLAQAGIRNQDSQDNT